MIETYLRYISNNIHTCCYIIYYAYDGRKNRVEQNGVIGVLMRVEDKIQRSMSMSMTKNGLYLVNDEGIRDTLIDLHNYAAMALMDGWIMEDNNLVKGLKPIII